MAAYTGYLVGYTAIRIAALTLLVAMVVIPPLVVQWTFPLVREWWAEQDSALVGNAGFVALIGVLGPIPYLFIKSMEMIPSAVRAIWRELRAIMLGPWVPSYCRRKSLGAVTGEMASGLAKAMAASWGLIASLATSVAVVMLAGTVAVPPVALVSIRTEIDTMDGATFTETRVERLVAGDEMVVDVSCVTGGEDRTCVPMVMTTVVGTPDPFPE